MESKVKWFNNTKGYGFIEYTDTEDIFVHYSAIDSHGYKTLQEGQNVNFDLIKTDAAQFTEEDLKVAKEAGLLKDEEVVEV